MALAAATALWTSFAAGAAELVNGTFDTDLSGWYQLTSCIGLEPEECPNLWDTEDRLGSPSSGSVIQRKTYAGGVNKSMKTCLAKSVEEGGLWTGSAWVFLPASNPPAKAWLQLVAWDGASCDGNELSIVSGAPVSAEGAWLEIRVDDFVVPAGGASIMLALRLEDTDATVPVEARFDDARLGVFISSFDDVLLDDWSDAVP